MKPLTEMEIQQVNGGVPPLAVAAGIHLVGQAAAIWGAYNLCRLASK